MPSPKRKASISLVSPLAAVIYDVSENRLKSSSISTSLSVVVALSLTEATDVVVETSKAWLPGQFAAYCEREHRDPHTLHPEVLSFQSAQMSPKLRRIVLIVATVFAAVAGADLDPSLVGTWTTKSRKVITGPVL